MTALSRILFACCALMSGAVPLAAANASAVTMIPFENASGVLAAQAEIGDRVVTLVRERGWSVTDTDVRPLLEHERIRYFDSLDEEARRKVLAATGGAAVLSGTIYTFADGRNPVVAVASRLVAADGTLLWSQVTAVSADDEESLFGLRRAKDARTLAGAAVADLMRSFPRPGSQPRLPRGPSKPLFLARVSAYRASEAAPMYSAAGRRRICVLPFENRSSSAEATQIVHDTLVVRLASDTRLDVVDPAALRSAARDIRIGSFRGISNADLARVADATGATLFVRGTVYGFVESAAGQRDPELDLEMSILDIETGQLVWAGQHERRGSDYTGLFLLGAESSAVALADRVITEMMAAAPRESPRAAEAFVAARIARNARKKPTELTQLDPSRNGGEDKK